MSYEYYPFSDVVCHHVYNRGGCIFCGFKSSKKCISKTKIGIEEMIGHFDSFSKNNLEHIKKAERLIIAPNGSWFSEVPRELREHVYNFIEKNNIPSLKYECRATLFNRGKILKEFYKTYYHLYGKTKVAERLANKTVKDITKSLDEIIPSHIVSLGLEVANNADLRTLNKGCSLKDYIHASKEVHYKGAKVCCNILLSPPKIDNPIKKAFETARFGKEKIGADEFLIMPCIPMKNTVAYKEWTEGRWNPLSSTASSEVFRIIKTRYPSVKTRYLDLRVFSFHGRHGRFERKPGKWSREEKQKERIKVRKIFFQEDKFINYNS